MPVTSSGPASRTTATPATSTAASTPPPAVAIGEPALGAADIGDPDFPGLGNGGYDVDQYLVRFSYDPATRRLDGATTVVATATQALARFNLDLAGLTVSAVSVDGADAAFVRRGEELEITPPTPLAAGRSFTTLVAYAGVPAPRANSAVPTGWLTTATGAYSVNEPDGSHGWFPSNDHPADKARFRFDITVPNPLTAVANGRFIGSSPASPTTTTWSYLTSDTMATYLAQVAIGPFVVTEATSARGVPVRLVVDKSLTGPAIGTLATVVDQLAVWFGPYPHEAAGMLIVNSSFGAAMESQTLATFGSDWAAIPIEHEFAHEWFGNSVTPARWNDIWLNEGFATYAEWLMSEQNGRATADAIARRVNPGRFRGPIADRPAGSLFDDTSYTGGAYVLHALRLTIGDAPFFRLLKTWPERFKGRSVTTADFERVATDVGERDLSTFFTQYLHSAAVPALPR
ncbi:MAG: M1 family metallopeptidase [Acidimicrobiia bacterium]